MSEVPRGIPMLQVVRVLDVAYFQKLCAFLANHPPAFFQVSPSEEATFWKILRAFISKPRPDLAARAKKEPFEEF